MNQNYETAPTSTEESIFPDRHEPYFKQWMTEQGLPHDAPDVVIADTMTEYLAGKSEASVNPLYQ